MSYKIFLNKFYIFFLIVFALLFLWIAFTFQTDITSNRQTTTYTTISDYTVETLSDSTAPTGIIHNCTFTLNPEVTSFGHLIFHSIHQEVIVYLDGTCIYSLTAGKDNSFGHTPGRVWNAIQFTPDDIGKEIQITFIPVYNSSINSLPKLYFGDHYDLMISLIMRDMPALLISTIAILAGIFYIAFTLYAYKRGTADNTLISLGMFAILIGLWKISDMDIFPLLVNNHPAASYLPFFTLLSACVPCIMFIRSLHSTKGHWIWYVPCAVSCTSMLLETLLQLLHIADFRETLILTHISIVSLVAVALAMVIYEIRRYGLNKQTKVNVICLSACMIALLVDLCIYYIMKAQATMLCGILVFVIYIFIIGFHTVNDIHKLIAIGQEAEKYEQMAYHDKLTGLFNRTAYADYISKEDFTPEQTIVAMFDLNNLKKCNDEYGHDQGDIYITTCAKLIQDCFSDVGNCYRLGGDEFCVLMRNISLETCRNKILTLQQRVMKENEKHKIGIPMAIACGYVLYDKRIDYDIQDAVRRADKMMYKEKYSMKHGITNTAK